MMLQALIAALEKLVASLRKRLPPIPVPIVTAEPSHPAHISQIPVWAKAIQAAEGYSTVTRSFINCNPGNLKFTNYTKSLGALRPDHDNFCIFATYQDGFNALQQFLRDACTDKLAAFHSTMSLNEFTNVYAEPPSFLYVNAVAHALNAKVEDQIKNFL